MKKITKAEISQFLKEQVSLECSIPIGSVRTDVAFVESGMDSLKAVYIMDRLEKFIGAELSPLYFWDNPTIASLAGFLAEEILQKPANADPWRRIFRSWLP